METEMDLVDLKSQTHNSLRNILSYLTLQDCENEGVLMCYLLCLLISMIVLVVVTVRKISDMSEQDIFRELYNSILRNDTVTCISIVRRYPAMINMVYAPEGYSPFLRACLNGSTQLVQIMLTAGADINLKSANNENAFYLAVFNHIKFPDLKDASCIHTLYYAGVNINEPNGKGYTPLHLAASFGHFSLVKWLLVKGADCRIGPNPYLLARTQGHFQTAIILKNKMEEASS